MNLAELQAEVINITNRPDLVAKTLSAVQSATLKAHHTDYYYKDIYEAEVDFVTAQFEPDFEYRTFVPRWRAAKYFRKYDPVSGAAGLFLTKIDPENALDSYSQARTDIWYGAGEIIHLKSSTEERYILMGCYRHPDITTGTFDSFIALDHPWAIVYGAARTIFSQIGKTDEAKGMAQEVAEQYRLLMTSEIREFGE
jgi:hypothetical protein